MADASSSVAFAVVSFIVAVVFLGTFDEAVLSTLICFAVDSDLHDGVPKFGPKSYHDKLAAIYDFGGEKGYTDDMQAPLTGGYDQQNQQYPGQTQGYNQAYNQGYPQQNN